jgi:hypothetical protein
MHPRWQQVLVGRLKSAFPNVQFIVSTHSPLIVAGLDRSEVVRFERAEDGAVEVTVPQFQLKGVGAGGLLTSEIFGLSSQLDEETAEALDRKRHLTARRLDPELPEEERAADVVELKILEEKLRFVDATSIVRDPLYPDFVKAMAREAHGASAAMILTAKQRRKRADAASRIVRNLLKKDLEKNEEPLA